MGSGQTSKIGRLVTLLMEKVAAVAGEDDWEEADGWVGKWTIAGPANVELVYEIRGGKFFETSEQETYTGEVKMSEDTFLALAMPAAIETACCSHIPTSNTLSGNLSLTFTRPVPSSMAALMATTRSSAAISSASAPAKYSE